MELDLQSADFSPVNGKTKNITGQTFGYWTVWGYAGLTTSIAKTNAIWLVRCICGTWKLVTANGLRTGKSKSCGCRKGAMITAGKTKHGHALAGRPSREYRAYVHAKARCEDPNDISYHNYGARGIEFRFNSFEEFLAEVGLRPSPLHSLDRINNERHYETGNLQWSDRLHQNRNKRTTKRLTACGLTLPITEWAERERVKVGTFWWRLKKGWCHECTIFNSPKGQCFHVAEVMTA